MTPDRSVFVATADRLFAESARAFLERRSGWSCAGTAQDGIGALAALARAQPDALLVTGRLGRIGATVFAAQVRRRWPDLPIVLLGRVETAAAHVVDPSATAEEVFAALRVSPAEGFEGLPSDRARELEVLASLTRRERVVLKLIASGVTLVDAAARLGLSEHTVRTHVQNLYDKMDCHSRLDLIRFAERHGLVAAPGGDP